VTQVAGELTAGVGRRSRPTRLQCELLHIAATSIFFMLVLGLIPGVAVPSTARNEIVDVTDLIDRIQGLRVAGDEGGMLDLTIAAEFDEWARRSRGRQHGQDLTLLRRRSGGAGPLAGCPSRSGFSHFLVHAG
jgi:hypothetical protein